MLKRFKSSVLSEFVDTKTSAMVLRLFASAFIIYGHGFGKIMMLINGNFEFYDPIGIGPEFSLILAAFAEGVCAFLILIGFWTRLASLILMINLSVAAFIFHAADGFGTKERALLYLLAFTIIFLIGPGNHSIDQTRTRS